MSAPIPGLEGRHTWNGYALNDLTVWPRNKLKGITGLRAKPERDDNKNATPGRIGEIHYPSLLRGKTVVYEGMIQAVNLDQLRRAESDMLGSFVENEEGVMALNYHPDYGPGTGIAFQYTGSCLTCDIPDVQEVSANALPTPFQRKFIIGIRMADPRIYNVPAEAPAPTSSAQSTSGLAIPFSPPATIAGETLGGSVTVTNLGTAWTDPLIDMHGPVLNPKLIHNNTGKQLIFQNLQLSSTSDFVRVDFRDRSIRLQGTTERDDFLDLKNSDWWDPGVRGLLRGQNTILYRGTGVGIPEMAPDAYAYISFSHANF